MTIQIDFSLTLRDPTLTEHKFSWLGEEGAEFEQARDEGQSPHEQPKEVSPHEYVDTFIGFIPDDSGALGERLIAYGDPGTPSGAFLPIKAYHSAKYNYESASKKILKVI